MSIKMIVAITVIVWVVREYFIAPVGYEDDSGFHYDGSGDE